MRPSPEAPPSGYAVEVPERLPHPGPSYLREQELRAGDRHLRVGMSRPTTVADEWWFTVLWVTDDDGVVSFGDLAPAAGPPPEPPLATLGPVFAGALSGLILEDEGRLQLRLAPMGPPDDPTRPWRLPAAVRAAFRWEPLRVATMRDTELAEAVLSGFRRAVESLRRP